MHFEVNKKIFPVAVLLLVSQTAFANELNKMGGFFVLMMGLFAMIVFFLLLPFLFIIKSKRSLLIFSVLNLIFLAVNRIYLLPEEMFLSVILWFHGAIQAVGTLIYYWKKKHYEKETL